MFDVICPQTCDSSMNEEPGKMREVTARRAFRVYLQGAILSESSFPLSSSPVPTPIQTTAPTLLTFLQVAVMGRDGARQLKLFLSPQLNGVEWLLGR